MIPRVNVFPRLAFHTTKRATIRPLGAVVKRFHTNTANTNTTTTGDDDSFDLSQLTMELENNETNDNITKKQATNTKYNTRANTKYNNDSTTKYNTKYSNETNTKNNNRSNTQSNLHFNTQSNSTQLTDSQSNIPVTKRVDTLFQSSIAEINITQQHDTVLTQILKNILLTSNDQPTMEFIQDLIINEKWNQAHTQTISNTSPQQQEQDAAQSNWDSDIVSSFADSFTDSQWDLTEHLNEWQATTEIENQHSTPVQNSTQTSQHPSDPRANPKLQYALSHLQNSAAPQLAKLHKRLVKISKEETRQRRNQQAHKNNLKQLFLAAKTTPFYIALIHHESNSILFIDVVNKQIIASDRTQEEKFTQELAWLKEKSPESLAKLNSHCKVTRLTTKQKKKLKKEQKIEDRGEEIFEEVARKPTRRTHSITVINSQGKKEHFEIPTSGITKTWKSPLWRTPEVPDEEDHDGYGIQSQTISQEEYERLRVHFKYEENKDELFDFGPRVVQEWKVFARHIRSRAKQIESPDRKDSSVFRKAAVMNSAVDMTLNRAVELAEDAWRKRYVPPEKNDKYTKVLQTFVEQWKDLKSGNYEERLKAKHDMARYYFKHYMFRQLLSKFLTKTLAMLPHDLSISEAERNLTMLSDTLDQLEVSGGDPSKVKEEIEKVSRTYLEKDDLLGQQFKRLHALLVELDYVIDNSIQQMEDTNEEENEVKLNDQLELCEQRIANTCTAMFSSDARLTDVRVGLEIYKITKDSPVLGDYQKRHARELFRMCNNEYISIAHAPKAEVVDRL